MAGGKKGKTGGGIPLVKGLEEVISGRHGPQSGTSCLGREVRPEDFEDYVLEGENQK